MSELTEKDIKIGRVYEAKKPQRSACGLVNDRQVEYISSAGNYVQYDGPSVAPGRRFPTVTMEQFLKWAGKDVTDEMPNGEWRSDWTRQK